MTDLARVTWTGDHGVQMEMHPTAAKANKAATELRKAGISSVVEKITLNKMGKKDLLSAIYNGVETGAGENADGNPVHGFAEKVEVLKSVEGVKKPSDPVLAEKLKQKQIANKYRGIAPVVGTSKAGTENPSMVPEVSQSTAASTGSSGTASSTAGAGTGKTVIDKSTDGKTDVKPAKVKIAPKAPVEVNKTVSDQAPKAENKGDMTTADLKAGGGIKL